MKYYINKDEFNKAYYKKRIPKIFSIISNSVRNIGSGTVRNILCSIAETAIDDDFVPVKSKLSENIPTSLVFVSFFKYIIFTRRLCIFEEETLPNLKFQRKM